MPLVVVMVGLPARGKTYTAQKIARYFQWLGHEARVFNVGNYRRERLGSQQPASFFDPDNPDGRAARRAMAEAALLDLFRWLDTGGEVAVYDATNITRERRTWVRSACLERGLEPIFVESVCNDRTIVDANIRQTKLLSPDYAKADPDQAVEDFRARIGFYELAYEPISDESLSWVKVIDVGRQVIANRVQGALATRIVSLVMNLHITPRTVYFTRHGESAYNVTGQLGGDPRLSPRGARYGPALARFFAGRPKPPVHAWTSALRRTVDTAAPLPMRKQAWRVLDEIDAGVCDGWTYAEVAARMPDDFARRYSDKLRYRYPQGESYQDVMARLGPAILELERQREPVVVVAHNAVIRCLYAWFSGRSVDEAPHLEIPLHTVIAITPRAYGIEEERFCLELDLA
ncbi:MAG: broad specificity phosphatase PhoE/predicted kinase [Myxococcota bacterium]